MRKCFSITHYEYKMQMTRIATWGILIVAVIVALLDNYPSSGNLARLEFLTQPSYFVYRTMSLDGLIMIFGLMFLLSSRMSLDKKTGVKSLMMASPITKGQYVSGKLVGGFLYTFTILTIFLTLNTLIYFIAVPFDASITDCAIPLVKTLVFSALPVGVFVSFVSIALPAVMDIRLFYLLASVLFIINAASIGSAEQMPFYLITSGDLMKLIWQHPKYPFTNIESIQANAIFLIGCGITAFTSLFLKRKFWRTES